MQKDTLWKNSDTEYKDLRLPKEANLKPDAQGDDTKNVEPPVSVVPPEKSKLNVSATEFVPRFLTNYMQTEIASNIQDIPAFLPPRSSVQDRLKKHKEQALNEGSSDIGAVCGNDINHQRLQQLIKTLINDPGQFDNLLDIFQKTLTPLFNDVSSLTDVTDLLVKEAVTHQSFRYTCARLCVCLEQDSPRFRAQLHLTCKNQLEKNTNKQGIVLFIAELYTQLFHENIYGKCLTDAFKELLDVGGDDNIKCVCQALKLTGRSLEQYDNENLNEVIDKLIKLKDQVKDKTSLCLLESVLNLKNSKWGYANSENLSNESDGEYWEEEEGNTASTVFYNADGNSLTQEEAEFLAANFQSDDYLLIGGDPDELCDPEPEMDEEIQAAFKEFVRLSKR